MALFKSVSILIALCVILPCLAYPRSSQYSRRLPKNKPLKRQSNFNSYHGAVSYRKYQSLGSKLNNIPQLDDTLDFFIDYYGMFIDPKVEAEKTCRKNMWVHNALHLPNICDCHLFYECDRGEAHLHQCPSGLEFHPAKEVCVFARDYDCPEPPSQCDSKSTVVPTTHVPPDPTTITKPTTKQPTTTKPTTTQPTTAKPITTQPITTKPTTTKLTTTTTKPTTTTTEPTTTTTKPTTTTTKPTTTTTKATTTTTKPTPTTTTKEPTTSTLSTTTTTEVPTTTEEWWYVTCEYIDQIIPDVKDCHYFFICKYDSFHEIKPERMVNIYTTPTELITF